MTVAGLWLAATTAPPTTSDIDPTTGHGEEWGKAAPIGLLVIVLLVVACYFLARSFSKQVKRVPASFDPADRTAPPDHAAPPDQTAPPDPQAVVPAAAPARDQASAAEPARTKAPPRPPTRKSPPRRGR